MHSRLLGAAMALIALVVVAPPAARAARGDGAPPPIFVGGRLVKEPAILERGHLLVPVRGVFEALHASVSYTPPRIVVVRKNESVIAGLLVDETNAVVNNTKRYLAVAPTRRGGRVYVPLRFVAETAGASVIYSSHPRLVDIRVPSDALAILPKRVAEPVVPPENGPPLWAFGLVGMIVAAFSAELLRRLAESVRAKRTNISR